MDLDTFAGPEIGPESRRVADDGVDQMRIDNLVIVSYHDVLKIAIRADDIGFANRRGAEQEGARTNDGILADFDTGGDVGAFRIFDADTGNHQGFVDAMLENFGCDA